jgi:hypothetical protein
MSHSKPVSSANPGCIIFLVDHSNSMLDPIAGSSKSKIDAVATAVNRFFMELISHCETGGDKPKNRFDIGGFSYTTDNQGHPIVESIFQQPLAGQDLVNVVQLYDNPLRTEKRMRKEPQDDGAGGVIMVETPVDFVVWYQTPPAERMFGTPMAAAFRKVYDVAAKWCAEHANSFPPIVLHFTDGEANDEGFKEEAARLQSLATDDGNLLLFNCHLSQSDAVPIFLPATEASLPDQYSKDLFQMSGVLSDAMRHRAEMRGMTAAPGSRGMAFNADSARMLLLIDIGTPITDPKLR